ncbi:MAG: class I SAM-dependent DNA methyltransferase [Gemmataceae bacterium]
MELLAPLKVLNPDIVIGDRLLFPELDFTPEGKPELVPYEGLASLWHEYSRISQPEYPKYLQHLARENGIPLDSILEVACGTGTLTEQLAAVAPRVMGLDISSDMLCRARTHCAGLKGVTFTQGDFRSFQLHQEFDAAICSFNSLNYLANTTELAQVFRQVARHLRPGGFFLFDTVTHFGMLRLSGLYLHYGFGRPDQKRRFALRFQYDLAKRVELSIAFLPNGIEQHIRVPIDPVDVEEAAQGSGLRVEDYFGDTLSFGPQVWEGFCFFILVRDDSA